MCGPLALPAAIIGSAVVGAGASLYAGSKARSQAQKAQAQNVAMAETSAKRAENQFNRLNQKQPGVAALLAGNRAATSKGIGSTFLTGTAGVPMGKLPLGGGPTLLGA